MRYYGPRSTQSIFSTNTLLMSVSLLFSNFPLLFVQRFYHLLELKSKDPDAAVPPLDETLKRITEPDPEVIFHNKLVIDEFRKHFELKENPKVKEMEPTFTSLVFL